MKNEIYETLGVLTSQIVAVQRDTQYFIAKYEKKFKEEMQVLKSEWL